MKASDNAINFIKHEEGCVLHAYRDSAGIVTTGWGSTYYPDGKPIKMGDKISQIYADTMLNTQVQKRAAIVLGFLGDTVINQNQFDALVSFAYNCGIIALKDSTLLKKVLANPTDPTIREEFMKWSKITVDGKKVISKDLLARREREANLYFS